MFCYGSAHYARVALNCDEMKGMSPRTPVTLTLPAFRGAVRRLILVLLAIYFGVGILLLVSPHVAKLLLALFLLTPIDVLRHGYVWQVVTYAFFNGGILGFAFAC